MKLTNQIENRLLIAGSVVATIFGFWLVLRLLILPTYNIQIEFLHQQIEQKDVTIQELAKIAKYSINNNFDKVKNKNGSIDLQIDNLLDASQINEADSVQNPIQPAKQNFLKRLFGSKK